MHKPTATAAQIQTPTATHENVPIRIETRVEARMQDAPVNTMRRG